MDGLIGKTFGPYRILEQIGMGGMATVYKAYQPSLDRYVAVKVLPSHLSTEAGFSRRFRREARAVAKLEHPHILAVHDFGQEDELAYIAMRYVDAGTLKDLMGQPLDLVRIADLIGQIAEALDHAHEHGIVHRDVKPSNVLLDRGEWVLLSDFGLARMMVGSQQITATGVGIGTPAYMSPEQGLGERADRRSDVYSLGVVLYEMLTGGVPYQAETPIAVVLKHINEPLPLPRDVNPEIPEAMERVVLKAMAKAPDDRYQTAGELARALQAAAQEADTAKERSQLADGVLTQDVLAEVPRPAWTLARLGQFQWVIPAALLVVGAVFLLSRVPLRVQISGGQLEVVRVVEKTATSEIALATTPKESAMMATATSAAVAALHWEQVYVTGLSGPFGMAFDTNGNLFIANEIYDGDGATVSLVTPAGVGSTFATGFDSPAGVAFNSAGILHVSDDTNRVFRVSALGEVTPFIEGVTLANPNTIAFDAEDNLYVVSQEGGFVSKFDANGTPIELELASGFNSPQGIVVDDSADVLFVSDVDGKIFQIDKLTGATNLYVDTAASFDGGLAMDSSGNLYLSNDDHDRVVHIAASNRNVTTCLSGIPYPRGLAFDLAGRIYVASYWTGRIYRASGCAPTSTLISKIVYVDDRSGNWEIYVANSDGSGERRLTDDPGGDWDPAWSPDGTRIVFTSDREADHEDDYQLYVMDADGSNPTRLTHTDRNAKSPSWSPDGSRIAFHSFCGLAVINADGSNWTILVEGSEDLCVEFPNWAPESHRIAFRGMTPIEGPGPYQHDIYVANEDGSGLLKLATFTSEERDWYVAWSPDGSRVAFDIILDGQQSYYAVNSDGSGEPAEIPSIPDSWYPWYWPQWAGEEEAPPLSAAPTPTPTDTSVRVGISGDVWCWLEGPAGDLSSRNPQTGLDAIVQGRNAVGNAVQVLVESSNGEVVVLPPHGDIYGWEGRFGGMSQGLPQAGGTYTFTALDADSTPIPGAVGSDVYVGGYEPDPPTNVQAEVVETGILVTWDPSPDIAGAFEPNGSPPLGFYSISIYLNREGGELLYGWNHENRPLPETSYLIPFRRLDFGPGDTGLALEEMDDGVYYLEMLAFSVAPEGTAGYYVECIAYDRAQNIRIVVEGGQVQVEGP